MIDGIGIDIIENSRIQKIIENKSFNQLKKIFTFVEYEYATKNSKKIIERFAVRFAVKEAFYKAFGMGFFSEIEVQHKDKKPLIVLYGRTKQEWMKRNMPTIHVTLSHTDHYATAMVIIES